MFKNKIGVRLIDDLITEIDFFLSIVVDETDPNAMTMFTKTLAIIDCISTLITIRPDNYDRFNGIILRIIHLLPG